MQKLISEVGIKGAIHILKYRQSHEKEMLKEQIHLAYENIQPINIIKSAFKEVTSSQDLKANVVNTSWGQSIEYISKILFGDVSQSPFKSLLGTFLISSLSNIIIQNPETVKALGITFLRMFRISKQTQE